MQHILLPPQPEHPRAQSLLRRGQGVPQVRAEQWGAPQYPWGRGCFSQHLGFGVGPEFRSQLGYFLAVCLGWADSPPWTPTDRDAAASLGGQRELNELRLKAHGRKPCTATAYQAGALMRIGDHKPRTADSRLTSLPISQKGKLRPRQKSTWSTDCKGVELCLL